METDLTAAADFSSKPEKNKLSFLKSGFSFRRIRRSFRKSLFIPIVVILFFVFLTGYFTFRSLSKQTASGSATDAGTTVQNNSNQDTPVMSRTVNREFIFPVFDDNGNEITKIKYAIQNVELRNQIIIKGEKADAVPGRIFLIINLKLTNDFQKSVQLNTRDYVRVMINGSNDKLAPDIHNDPVEVQAISTKFTRLGLAINTTDRNISLQIGAIDGKKEYIPLHLQ